MKLYNRYCHNEGDEMMMDDIDEFVSNPINTFTMIKRLTLYWPSVRDHLFNQTLIDQWDDFLEEVQSFNELLLADQKLWKYQLLPYYVPMSKNTFLPREKTTFRNAPFYYNSYNFYQFIKTHNLIISDQNIQ